jgi:hypothetical protein
MCVAVAKPRGENPSCQAGGDRVVAPLLALLFNKVSSATGVSQQSAPYSFEKCDGFNETEQIEQ